MKKYYRHGELYKLFGSTKEKHFFSNGESLIMVDANYEFVSDVTEMIENAILDEDPAAWTVRSAGLITMLKEAREAEAADEVKNNTHHVFTKYLLSPGKWILHHQHIAGNYEGALLNFRDEVRKYIDRNKLKVHPAPINIYVIGPGSSTILAQFKIS